MLEQRKSAEDRNPVERRAQRRSRNVEAHGNDEEQWRTERDRAAAAHATTPEAAATHSVQETIAILGTTATTTATARETATTTALQGHGSRRLDKRTRDCEVQLTRWEALSWQI